MKILVADDDTDLLDVTSYALRRDGYTVVTATDGQQAIDQCAAERPDLVLLDVGMPRMSGFEVCRRIREIAATPVIMLTARSDDDNVVQGFLTGADDYVTKPFSHRQLAARIRAVLNRTAGGLSPEPIGEVRTGNLRLDDHSHEVTVGDRRAVRLTPLEFRIMYMLATNEGRVVSSQRLVEYAWGYEGGEASLIKTHISHIRQKLGIERDKPGYVRVVPWVGYSLVRG